MGNGVSGAGWVNRIVGHDEVAPDQLLANPLNWRIHPKFQRDALLGVIRDVGYVRSVTVNERTGFVVDGHLRVTLAISEGQAKIPVEYVDLSPEEEAEVLASLDPLASLAVMDAEIMGQLLDQVETGDAAVQRLLDDLALDIEGELRARAGLNGDGNKHDLDRLKTAIKPVLFAGELAIFEEAIRQTGLVNRGEALIAVCRAYLDHEKG